MSREIKRRQAYLRQENLLYSETFVSIPEKRWAPLPDGWPRPDAVYRSSRFLAQVFARRDGARRISVMRTMIDESGNWLQGISWDDLMAVKSGCGFANCWAVECFPAETEVVNVANLRHLFVLPEAPAFAWRRNEVHA